MVLDAQFCHVARRPSETHTYYSYRLLYFHDLDAIHNSYFLVEGHPFSSIEIDIFGNDFLNSNRIEIERKITSLGY